MSENRIRVKLEDELTPVRREERMDLNAEIKVDVDSHLKGLAVVGLVAIALGTIALLVGAVLFTLGYPDQFKGSNGVTFEEATGFIERTVLMLTAGIILLLAGTSSFFYGRTVLGSGHVDQFVTKELEIQEGA